jgi:formylglycine-generating enzyme required for sulfatase activity
MGNERTSLGLTMMTFGVVALVACGPNKEPAMPSTGPSTGEAFGGVQCTAVRPQTEPDLMAWDSGSRATLRSVKEQGVVVVRYEAEGCNVQLHVLPNCVAKGSYAFSPYSAKETKMARTANELFAELPVGAAKLSTKLKGTHAIRTDYMMAGVESLKIGSTFKPEELVGDCGGATHVVSKIYVGGFALAAGETRDLEGGASVFLVPAVSAGGGAKTGSAVEHLQHEGSAKACEEAQEKGTPSPQCSVPLRIALMSLGAKQVACPSGSTWDGKQCAGPGPQARVEAGAMVRIPAGTFLMGSPDGVGAPSQHPQHGVQVASFELDVTEVTTAAYTACVTGGKCTAANTGLFCNYGKPDKGNHPINCVDWNQATTYCSSVGKRLPTEEEWEYAARGTDGRSFPWGHDAPGAQVCWNRLRSKQGTCPVASFPSGRTPNGVLDMAGNVWELTSSAYSEDYSKGRTSTARVARGGSWDIEHPGYLHNAYRTRGEPSERDLITGFRCAR